MHSCQQLTRWIDQLRSEFGDLEIRIEYIQKRLRDLADSRRENLTNAGIGAATAAAGALGSAVRAARTAQRLLRGGRLRGNDLLAAIPYIGGAILTARGALAAVRDSREIREVDRELAQLQRMAKVVDGTREELDREWRENRCDQFYS